MTLLRHHYISISGANQKKSRPSVHFMFYYCETRPGRVFLARFRFFLTVQVILLLCSERAIEATFQNEFLPCGGQPMHFLCFFALFYSTNQLLLKEGLIYWLTLNYFYKMYHLDKVTLHTNLSRGVFHSAIMSGQVCCAK